MEPAMLVINHALGKGKVKAQTESEWGVSQQRLTLFGQNAVALEVLTHISTYISSSR